jgi:hypothetical protein
MCIKAGFLHWKRHIKYIQEFLLIFSAKLFYKLFFRNLKIKHGIRALKLIPKRGVNCENRLIKLLLTQNGRIKLCWRRSKNSTVQWHKL